MNIDAYLERALAQKVSRRAFAKRLDMALKRTNTTSGRVAKHLAVSESDVTLWRAGVTTPNGTECSRICSLLHVNVEWLCEGDSDARSHESGKYRRELV
ncbi:XRE family transcriptional regulator [Paraburkholderia nemoris]|uniref:XRE family transcriptional regulator n=1 Tax=Paraburkholderia nemoris TaxID=2793076 RepID=UPI0038B9CA81